ncbi:MAG: hypothetical protein FD123_576 [Bacteroidetes bacterium]|nr:MAG: hypothetical protein FD123_576 [Bacteroidota bacterium]
MIDMNAIVGKMNIALITLDTLRYDVAQDLFAAGRTPNLASVIPGGWEKAHSPGSFTFAAHTAFFAGFLPTPATPGNHTRLFAAKFRGSETTGPGTCVFETADIVTGLAQKNYRTICIGGVGFFNEQTPLGSVLPGLFSESYWKPAFGVTDPASAKNQFHFAAGLLAEQERDKPVFLFINISAIHQPNYFYREGAKTDSFETHGAALEYVDAQLPVLFDALRKQNDTFCIFCSDHGTAYGEDGYRGHRVGPVPYASCILKGKTDER